jgi:hypothetical protein
MTLVTCLFDLTASDAEHAMTKGRPRLVGGMGGYLSMAQALLRQPVPLVIFTEPSLVTALSAIRPPSATARYCALQLTELPLFEEIHPHFCELFHERYFRYVNPVKDTPSYLTLVNSKWSMLRNVAESNPYDTEFIGWIDIGLAHVVGREMDQLPLLTRGGAHHPPGLCFGMPYPDAPHPIRDQIMRQFWGRICGGLLTMPTADAIRWEKLCSAYLLLALREGYYPFEVEVLYRLLLRTGKLSFAPDDDVTIAETKEVPDFQPYQAEYSGVISHHPAVTGIRSSSSASAG